MPCSCGLVSSPARRIARFAPGFRRSCFSVKSRPPAAPCLGSRVHLRMVRALVLVAGWTWLIGCQPRVSSADRRLDADGPPPSGPTAAPHEAREPPTSPPSRTPTPSMRAGTGAIGAECTRAADCAAPLVCLFGERGCSNTGKCSASGPRLRNCHTAIPMCSCASNRTFFGPGGCAGEALEPWELYACPCASDRDCVSEQRCVPVDARPHRQGATRECR